MMKVEGKIKSSITCISVNNAVFGKCPHFATVVNELFKFAFDADFQFLSSFFVCHLNDAKQLIVCKLCCLLTV